MERRDRGDTIAQQASPRGWGEGEEGGRRKDRKGRVRQRRTSALRQISAGARSLIGSKKRRASVPFLDSEASGELRNQGWQASYAAWGWFMKVHVFRIWKSFSLAVMVDTTQLESLTAAGCAMLFGRPWKGMKVKNNGYKRVISLTGISFRSCLTRGIWARPRNESVVYAMQYRIRT